MADTRTEITVDIYAGVPFNTKYQNVLFVNTQTRDLFLSHYSAGNQFTVGRFDIINDNQAIIDISNEYGTMSVNYLKVHKKLYPETSNSTFEYDLFYFVDHTLQIGTNVVRLFLELDIFQTYFVKYNYQSMAYEIPKIKNSRLEITTLEDQVEKRNVLEMTNFNNSFSFSPLLDDVENITNEVYIVFQYTEDNGYAFSCGIVKLPTYVFGADGQSQNHYRLENIIHGLQNGKLFLETSGGQQAYETLINVTHIYMVPKSMITIENVPHSSSRYYLKDNLDANFQVDFYPTQITNIYQYNNTISKTISVESGIQTLVGNFEKQIELPFNSKPYNVDIKMIIGETFQVILFANNETIDLTYSFEMSLLKNDYNEFMNSHETSVAVKTVSNAINLIGSVKNVAGGNPAGIISTTSTIKNIADDISTFVDLKNQPSKVVAEKSISSSFILFNMIGIFYNTPTNYNEIIDFEKYYGHKTNFLTSIEFVFISGSIRYFDYYKFSNIEIIGKLPETVKSRFEQMFLNGVRFWYSPTYFLETRANPQETQNENTPITILV